MGQANKMQYNITHFGNWLQKTSRQQINLEFPIHTIDLQKTKDHIYTFALLCFLSPCDLKCEGHTGKWPEV